MRNASEVSGRQVFGCFRQLFCDLTVCTQITPSSWKMYFQTCKPDLVVALADIPYSQAPQSQKRLQKSLERSTAWLSHLLSTVSQPSSVSPQSPSAKPAVLVSLVGGTDERARTTFSENLVEMLHGKEQEQISPLQTLDDGVAGYQFELLPIRQTLQAERISAASQDDPPDQSEELTSLMRSSLAPLPSGKPRIAYGARSPHEILRFICDVGIDLFDMHWAQWAANIGVALDFRFPVPDPAETLSADHTAPKPKSRSDATVDIGHNLFNLDYAHDHSRLASSFLDGASHSALAATEVAKTPQRCECGACSPVPFSGTILHDTVTQPPEKPSSPLPPYSRSYIHHLLHTHEMSSHTLLTMHNISVMDSFFSGIREVLRRSQAETHLFAQEIERFVATYGEPGELFAEAEKDWAKVESERGKGRLAREKEKQDAEVAADKEVGVVPGEE